MVVRSLLPKTLGLTKNGTVPGDFNVTLKSVGWARITSPSTQLQVATSIKQRMATYKHRSFTASLPLKKGGTDWQTLLSFLGHRNFSGTGWGSRTCNIMLYPWLLQVGDVYALKSREKKQSQVGDMFFLIWIRWVLKKPFHLKSWLSRGYTESHMRRVVFFTRGQFPAFSKLQNLRSTSESYRTSHETGILAKWNHICNQQQRCGNLTFRPLTCLSTSTLVQAKVSMPAA